LFIDLSASAISDRYRRVSTVMVLQSIAVSLRYMWWRKMEVTAQH